MTDKRLRTLAPLAGVFNLRGLRALSGRKVIFPFYHLVSDQEIIHLKHLYSYRNESQFESDLEALLKLYDAISIEEYLEGGRAIRTGKAKMVLSFDDGLSECHQIIAPMLKSKGVPAIFFLNNDFIDNRGLFYRYKASILTEHLLREAGARRMAAEYMEIPEEQIINAILMINYRQIPLLDALALHTGLDFAVYMRDHPVYMSSEEIMQLLKLGFHVGAHGTDHPEFYRMEEKGIEVQVSKSMSDLKERFHVKPACFAFPFTSDGVPEEVIDEILEEGIVDVVFGTAGLKNTARPRFIQRIPMEAMGLSAKRVLKSEYLYYLLKAPLGQNAYY